VKFVSPHCKPVSFHVDFCIVRQFILETKPNSPLLLVRFQTILPPAHDVYNVIIVTQYKHICPLCLAQRQQDSLYLQRCVIELMVYLKQTMNCEVYLAPLQTSISVCRYRYRTATLMTKTKHPRFASPIANYCASYKLSASYHHSYTIKTHLSTLHCRTATIFSPLRRLCHRAIGMTDLNNEL